MNLLSVLTSQQAYNAAVAINHMKKLQLAHSEQVLRQASIPDIQVIDVSSPKKNHKRLDPDPKGAEVNGKVNRTIHISLPTSPIESKSHYHTLKATHSQVPHHAPSMAEQGKNVYHSEPANLNGFVTISSDDGNFFISDFTAGLTNFSLLLSGTKTVTARLCRPESAQSCEGCVKFTRKQAFYLVRNTFVYLNYTFNVQSAFSSTQITKEISVHPQKSIY